MLPMIREKMDLLVIERPKDWDTLSPGSRNQKLKKYDIPLYRRDCGKYVLHRVIKVKKNGYVICGDNRYHREYGINDRHILGVLTAIIRNGEKISLKKMPYRCYVHLWCDLFPVRAVVIYFRDRILGLKKAQRTLYKNICNRSRSEN